MIKKIKQLFCKHEWEIVRKVEMFAPLNGEQSYKYCKTCGKITKYIFRRYEGNGYK